MDMARQTVLIRALFEDFQKKNPVTDAEAKAEYDKFVEANGGKEYKASHILVESEDRAKAIIAEVKAGKKFEDIAKKESKDPGSGARGGDLDWANPNNYVPEFTEALIKLKKGEMTDAPSRASLAGTSSAWMTSARPKCPSSRTSSPRSLSSCNSKSCSNSRISCAKAQKSSNMI
jgi:hypothetical protein